jgi:hypothetical protein
MLRSTENHHQQDVVTFGLTEARQRVVLTAGPNAEELDSSPVSSLARLRPLETFEGFRPHREVGANSYYKT